MTTRITVTTGDGGLLERNAQQQAANRQGTLVKGQAEQAAATGAEQQRQRRIAAGLDPATGRPLPSAGSTSRLTRIDQEPAAFRSGGAFLEFLPPATELATSPYTEPQFYSGDILLDKWWAVRTRGTTLPLAVGEAEEQDITTTPVSLQFREHAVPTPDNYFAADIPIIAAVASDNVVASALVFSLYRTPLFSLRSPRRRSVSFNCTLIAGEGQTINELSGTSVSTASTYATAALNAQKTDLSFMTLRIRITAQLQRDSVSGRVVNTVEIVHTSGPIFFRLFSLPVEQGSVNNVRIEMKLPNSIVITHNGSKTTIESDIVEEYLNAKAWYLFGDVTARRSRTLYLFGSVAVPLPPPPDVSAKVGRISIEWDR